MTTFRLDTLPAEFTWSDPPVAWAVESGNQLTIQAGAGTDSFFNPDGSERQDNAPRALFATGDPAFTFSAHVHVTFLSTFDAGTLQVRVSDDVWAKLCFEYSPQQQPMIVSVVTRGVSDDCNSTPIEDDNVFLRITRREATLAFHYSRDGHLWQLVRHFTLGDAARPFIGLSAQSPTGNGCSAVFSQVHYTPTAVADLRSGE
jgi:uncharacterized protein